MLDHPRCVTYVIEDHCFGGLLMIIKIVMSDIVAGRIYRSPGEYMSFIVDYMFKYC